MKFELKCNNNNSCNNFKQSFTLLIAIINISKFIQTPNSVLLFNKIVMLVLKEWIYLFFDV